MQHFAHLIKKAAFLRALAAHRSVARAAAAAGVHRATPYRWRKDDRGFAAQWDRLITPA